MRDKIEKVSLGGVLVMPFSSREQLIDYVSQNPMLLVAVNAEKIINSTDQTRQIINGNLGYCDGMGAVMCMHNKGHDDVVKIPGCELWLDIVAHFSKLDKSFYLVGSKPQVIEATVTKLREQFPGVRIVGYRDGYLKTDAESDALIADVAAKKPDVVFVAMGSPKQELLMARMQQQHRAIYQGLGGSFDVYTGNVERAPKWWLDHNLEWAYRLLKQPKRIKRQMKLVKLIWLLMLHKL